MTVSPVWADGLFPDAEVKMQYMTNCAECHGRKGRGSTEGPSLRDSEVIRKIDDKLLYKAISDGVSEKEKRHPASEFEGEMPGFTDDLTKEEIKSLTSLMRKWNKQQRGNSNGNE